MTSPLIRAGAVFLCAIMFAGAANAETLRWVRTSDALTLDPHARNEVPTLTLAHQIYEPLLQRDMAGVIIPSLATDWAVHEDDPAIWVFNLREGVTFHDGAAFDANDVVFSLNRAGSDLSDMRGDVASIAEVIRIDDHTVHIRTDGPNPTLPGSLTNIFMMDQGWAETNDAVAVQNYNEGVTNYATRNANGTGPYRLVSREPEVRTVLEANPDYWGIGQFPLEVTEIIYTPMQNQATRVAALLSGEVDFLQDVPVQDLDLVSNTEGLKLPSGPQNRVIYLGMQQGRADLNMDSVEGANPLADVRIRRAINLSVNREAIRQVVMRGQSVPTGQMVSPFVNGWSEELSAVPEHDLEAARSLIEDAGYGDGFEIVMHCPNDRYINDEAICEAIVGMLARVGINVDLEAITRSLFFPLLQREEAEFFLAGIGLPTFDSEWFFRLLVHTKTDQLGGFNSSGYAVPEVDAMIRSLSSEIDLNVRNATIADIWDRFQEDVVYIPVHYQLLNWGMRDDIEFTVQPSNMPLFKFMQLDQPEKA